VKKAYGDDLDITWKNFPLEQVNSKEGPDWKLWEQDESFPSRGLLALKAGEAAKKQGPEKFEKFHVALLNARHMQRKAIDKIEILTDVAKDAGLDIDKFLEDINDPQALKTIAADYTEASETYGVFGVPTMSTDSGASAFVKMMPPPESDKAKDVFQSVLGLVDGVPNLQEIKRPTPPGD
jgi:predicted DsbA family dithiol-disulfide isomerase